MPTTSQVGTAGKLDAHQRGLKHRAISVLVRNAAGEFLLQRRSPAKYHSGGLWTNACCSHPLPGESTADAARRRLAQEMGFACPIEPLFVFQYNTPVPGGLIENELVHVFGGQHDGPIKPDPAEVSEWKWIALRRARWPTCARGRRPTRSGSGNISTSTAACWRKWIGRRA